MRPWQLQAPAAPSCVQDARLKELWDDHGGAGGAAAAIAADMGIPRSVAARRIKTLGLKRGVLTEAQVLPPSLLLRCRTPRHPPPP